MSRPLVIVGYDVTDPARLAQARDVVTGWAAGGQRSVYECLVPTRQRAILCHDMRAVMRLKEDRLALFAVDGARGRALGIGSIARDEQVIWVA